MYPSSADAYKSLQNFSTNRKSQQQYIDEANSKYGLPASQDRVSKLRSTVGNLESSLDAVDPSVTGRTTGDFVTEGQRAALVNRERTPIISDLSKTGRLYSEAQQELSTNQSLADRWVSTLIGADDANYQKLLDQYNLTYAKEQSDKTFNEQQRQFNEQMALQKKAAASNSLDTSGIIKAITGNSSQTLPAGMVQKNNQFGNFDGYDFFAPDGKSKVTAGVWAKNNNVPLGDLLYQMGTAGDQTAARAYNWIKSIQGSDMYKSGKWKNTPAFQQYAQLFRGL